MRSALILLAALLLSAASSVPVPEPQGLWQGAMHGETPSSLKGARVVDTKTLIEMLKHERPVLIDVSGHEQRPPSVSKDTPWMPTHRTIPGSVWLADAGGGSSDPAFAKAFQRRIAELTSNDLSRQLVIFCHPHCWGSWNAAKRLVSLGYKHVNWYPAGVEGWQSTHDSKVARSDPLWEKAISHPKTAVSAQQGVN